MSDFLTIRNVNGTGVIHFRYFDLGSYLYHNEAKIIVWEDCKGSVGKYTELLDEPTKIKIKIEQLLQSKFNGGVAFELQDIFEELQTFCTLFPVGGIKVTKHNNHGTYADDAKFKYWTTVFLNCISKEDEKKAKQRYLTYFEEEVKGDRGIVQDIVEYLTPGFFPGRNEHYLIYTQSVDNLDNDRVRYYETLIRKGKRPYCLVYNTQTSSEDFSYVLDGHHKLKAYCNLEINPCVVELTQLGDEEHELDIDQLEEDIYDRLYTWQLRHIFDNTDDKEKLLQKLLNQPKNRFNQFVKNGFVEERWINGDLKSRGYYQNNKPEGILERYHENGRLADLFIFKNGNRIKSLRSWFWNGQLSREYIPKVELLNGEYDTYSPTGKIASRNFSENGKQADGKSSVYYDGNGKISSEVFYKDGKKVKQVWYDSYGKIKKEWIDPSVEKDHS